jgi:hypothetical protein
MSRFPQGAKNMEIEPVAKLEAPSYPSAKVADAGPLLSKHLPERWRKAKRLAGALAVTLAVNLSDGCGSAVGDSATPKRRSPVCVPPAGAQQDPLVAKASDWIRTVYAKPAAAVSVAPPLIRFTMPPARTAGIGPVPLPHVSEESPGKGTNNP